MNSQAVPSNLVLTRRSADGATELISIGVAHKEPALAGSAYTLIDRGVGFDAPSQLAAERQGADLVLLVNDALVLAIEGFFVTQDVIFYPAPDIIGGAGPFSGEGLTPESPVLAQSSGEVQTIWSAVPVASSEPPPETARKGGDDDQDGGVSPLVWAGLGVGLLAAAAGGGGGGGGSGGDAPVPAQSVTTSDTDAPQITSGSTADPIEENSGTGDVVYKATATDAGTITWSLNGADAAAFAIDPDSGVVTLIENTDFETQASFNFTVVARDGAGNSSSQEVVLSITNQDEVAPVITSGPIASSIDENSGAGQVVYTVTSTDEEDITSESTTYSLGNGGDGDAFSIDADTGVVRLTVNPDFEAQARYDFTVVATDAAGNSSQRGVSLAINDIDETVPSVVNVSLTDAVGAQGDILNAGDTVRVTVSMSTNITVDQAGGTPRIALDIDGDTVFADFVSGSGTESLVFEYVIQAGENDANGIRIRPNSIDANGATLTNAVGTPVNLNHGNIGNNPQFIVDTEAPRLRSSNPDDGDDDVAVDEDIELRFNEDIAVGSGNIIISDDTDTRIIDISDTSQVRLSGDRIFIDLTNDLNTGSNYSVLVESGAVTDKAGNGFSGISDATTLNFETEAAPVDTSIVVFDLVQGASSNHSGRSFQSGVSYDIYIRVDSNDSALSTAGGPPNSWGRWDDVDNLGSDDRIILVGNGGPVEGRFANTVEQIRFAEEFIAWESDGTNDLDAARIEGRSFYRITGGFSPDEDNARLFDSALDDDFFEDQSGNLSTRYLTSMPPGVLTSQGLV